MVILLIIFPLLWMNISVAYTISYYVLAALAPNSSDIAARSRWAMQFRCSGRLL
jgi:hypothetical protein